jgi:integrase
MKTMEVLEKVLKGKKLGRKSRANYRIVFRRLNEFTVDWPDKPYVFSEWFASLKLKDTSILLYYKIIKACCNYLEENLDVPNVLKKSHAPKVVKEKRRYFKREELMRIIGACKDEKETLLILGLIDSGCRIGEMASLEVSGIGDGVIRVVGKTGKRTYRLSRGLCERFRLLSGGEGFVFKKKDGLGYSGDTLGERVRAIIISAGITGAKLGAHSIRHSVGSMVAKETGSVLAVKAVLQHDKQETSMIYIHDVEEVLQQEISPLGIVMNGVKGEGGEQKPLMLGSGGEGDFIEVEPEVIDDMLEEKFREVNGGVSVRPKLKVEDISIIRKAFIGYIRSEGSMDEGRCRELYNRMLRKVGQ